MGDTGAGDAPAAAVSSNLPPGTLVFESISPGSATHDATEDATESAAEESASGDRPLQTLQEQYVAERQRADTLARVDRQRMTFFSDLSQECRTPLTLILGPAANLLAGVHGPLSEDQREQIRIVHENGVHLLKLVNTLFTFLRVEAGIDDAMWDLPDEIAALPPQAPEDSPLATASEADKDRTAGRILIADDHPGVLSYLQRLLGRQWTTEVVSDGHAALDAARARRPDLIIADVTMPGLDGLGLLRALRAEPRTAAIPVLLLSGRVGEESRVEGLLAGAADYLVKPFSDRELLAKVQGQIEVSNARRKDEEHIASWAAFYAAASHELRNPIHSLQLQVLAILRGLAGEQRTPKLRWVQQRVDKANDQLSRVIRLLDRLLDVSRISSGRLPLVLEDVDFADVATAVIERLDPVEQAQIIRSLDSTTGRWDRVRLEQVVTNLLTNALKYGEGQPIEVVVQRNERGARLAVTDRGIGVAVEHQERIFQRFERAVTDQRYSGFGLGLWITSRIVEELGGTLSLESVPGEGSTFIVELPTTPQNQDI